MKKSREHLAAIRLNDYAYRAELDAAMLLYSCKPTRSPKADIYLAKLRKNPMINQAFLAEIEKEIYHNAAKSE